MYEALLKSTPEYQKIAESLRTPGPAALFGLPPAGRALLYAALQKDLGRLVCIVTPGEAEATHFADDLKALGLTAAVFPPRDFMLRPVEGAGREYEYRRLSVLGALAGGRLNAVCVPAEALLQYTVPRDEFLRNTLTLKPGMVYNREALVARLFAAGYVRRSQVDGPGQFSVRGDIVDIYAPDMHQPARVEYWDDEIDSLASFDLLTQRRDGSLEKIYLSPAREVLFGNTAETAEALRGAIKKARGKKRTAMEKATEADLAQLDSGLMPEAMDKYYGIRYPQPATLLDHLDSPIFVLDEVGGIRDAQKATEYRRGEELTGLLEEGVLCPGLDVLYQTMDDLAIAAQKQSTLLCENFLRGMNEFKLKDLINAEAFAAVQSGTVKKGDVLGVARIAGIMATKRTSELIPLCHPLPLTKAGIEFRLLPEQQAVEALCTVKTSGVTGVEMEALTGVSTALLTIYDMCKAVDKGMELGEIHLVEKTGGKSGHYIRAEGGYV